MCMVLLAGLAGGVQAEPATVIRGATLLTMQDAQPLTGHLVVVEQGRIVAVRPEAGFKPPAGARQLDARGMFLMPGLAEMHAHVPGSELGEDYLRRVLSLYVANGVTTIRGMLGQPEHLALRASLERGDLLGPRLFTSGPSLNGRSVSSPEQGAAMVRAQREAGYDFVKLHPGLSLEAFQAISQAAAERAMPFAGHVSVDVGLARSLAAGQASIDHLDGYMQELVPPRRLPAQSEWGFFGFGLTDLADSARAAELAAQTARSGVWNVPTLALFENWVGPDEPEVLAARPEMRYVPTELLQRYRQAKREAMAAEGYSRARASRFLALRASLLEALDQAGAGLLLGSDAPQVFNVPGFSVHQELELMVRAGVAPYNALLAGTANPARFLRREGQFGVIAPGAAADLVMLGANPLEDIRNTRSLRGVMLAGRYLDRAELDGILVALVVR